MDELLFDKNNSFNYLGTFSSTQQISYGLDYSFGYIHYGTESGMLHSLFSNAAELTDTGKSIDVGQGNILQIVHNNNNLYVRSFDGIKSFTVDVTGSYTLVDTFTNTNASYLPVQIVVHDAHLFTIANGQYLRAYYLNQGNISLVNAIDMGSQYGWGLYVNHGIVYVGLRNYGMKMYDFDGATVREIGHLQQQVAGISGNNNFIFAVGNGDQPTTIKSCAEPV